MRSYRYGPALDFGALVTEDPGEMIKCPCLRMSFRNFRAFARPKRPSSKADASVM